MTNDMTPYPDLAQAYPAAREAAREIKLLRAMLTQVAQFAEARIMERLWEIRQELPDEGRFRAFVSQEIGMDGEAAERMARAWDSARKNRHLREFAQRRGGEAVTLVAQLSEVGFDPGDETDAEVAQMLGLPARKRSAVLRELIERAHETGGPGPAAKEQIRSLTAERDAALCEVAEARAGTQSAGLEMIRATGEMVKQARERTARALAMIDRAGAGLEDLYLTQAHTDCESVISMTEAVIARLLVEDRAGGGDDDDDR